MDVGSRVAGRILLRSWGGLVLAVILVTGCGGDSQTTETTEQARQRMQVLARMYGRFMAYNSGRLPPSEEIMRRFCAREDIASEIAGSGVGDVDKMLTSPRDNQPFQVFYRKVPRSPGINGDPIIAYESEGVDGLRLVVSQMGAIEEADSQRFAELVPEPK